MGTKANPAPNDCYQRAGDHEPMFTLLARDATAGSMVRMWACLRQRDDMGALAEFNDLCMIAMNREAKPDDGAVAAEARKCGEDMAFWRSAWLLSHGPNNWPVGTPSRPWPSLRGILAETFAHPVLDVLQQAAAPWGLMAIFRNLQLGGLPIPFHAEEEYAAALYFMLCHALEHGADWRKTIMTELREHQHRGLEIAVREAGFR